MDFSGLSIFSLMQNKMKYLSERQAVLAQNIANVDTPEYKAKDVKDFDFKSMLNSGSLKMAVTNPKHLQGMSANSGAFQVVNRSRTSETNLNGNTVSIDEEMQKVGQTQMEYQMITGLYTKTVGMLKTAVGRGGQF